MKRAAILLGSVGITLFLGWVAFVIGSWGYDTRRFTQHVTRMQHMLEQKPVIEQVVEGLASDGSPLIAAPRDPRALREAAQARGRDRAAEIVAKGTRWPQTRVFLAADMVYFVFFDADGVMRDFTCVSR